MPPSLPVKRVVSGRWLSCCFKICHKFGCSNAQRFELLLQLPHCYSPGFSASQEITFIQSTVYSIYIYLYMYTYIYIDIYIYVCQFLSWWLPSPLQKNNGPTAHLVGRTSPTALGIGDAQFGEFQCDHQCLRERLAMGESNLHLRKARVIWQNLLFFHVLLRKYV